MAQTKTSRVANTSMHRFYDPSSAICGDGDTIKSNSQIITHGLDTAVVAALQPGQSGIARKVIGPTFKRLWHFDSQLFGSTHDRRTRIGSKNVGTELEPGILFANIVNDAER